MTTIAAAQSASNAAATTTKKDTRSQIAGNFDQFLQLLTTQLKNQDPTAPLDTNQFTQQLVQFAQVEQQLKQNDTLTALLNMSKASSTSNAMSFVGNRVTMDGSTSQLKDGNAEWRLDAPRGGSATITIKDKSGNVVQTQNMTLNAGAQSFKWNGRTSTGVNAPEGAYSIVVDATDSQRNRIAITTEVTGVVDGADFTGETPVLVIGSTRIPVDKVKSVSRL
jgi:flagellar basal-body rod modification protein FlgD